MIQVVTHGSCAVAPDGLIELCVAEIRRVRDHPRVLRLCLLTAACSREAK